MHDCMTPHFRVSERLWGYYSTDAGGTQNTKIKDGASAPHHFAKFLDILSHIL